MSETDATSTAAAPEIEVTEDHTQHAGEECPERGMSIFHDIFRRADKNDDGMVSWEEFKGYFADGLLSQDELQKLFQDIDTHNTGNIDTGELCKFYGDRLGAWKAVFAAMEELSANSTSALRSTAAIYQTSHHVDQFVQRFLLREVIGQLAAVQNVLENANEAIEERSKADRTGDDSEYPKPNSDPISTNVDSNGMEDNVPPLPGRLGRRYRRQMSAPSDVGSSVSSNEPSGKRLQAQVDRLERLMQKMETSIQFEGLRDEKVCEDEEELILVVRRKIEVTESKTRNFREGLRGYIEYLNSFDACFHVGVRSYTNQDTFVLYELWESDRQWQKLSASDPARAFMHIVVDCCRIPEAVSSILLPGEWFKGS